MGGLSVSTQTLGGYWFEPPRPAALGCLPVGQRDRSYLLSVRRFAPARNQDTL